MHLATAQGEIYIKLPKALRYSSMQILHSGAWVQVQGYQKHDPSTGESKYKALTIVPTGPCLPLPEHQSVKQSSVKQSCPDLHVISPLSSEPSPPPRGKIMVCKKSSCRKRGSKDLCKALSQTLATSNLKAQVEISGMGCIGKCKAGPNILIMPDKEKYTRVKPSQAAEIIHAHFETHPAVDPHPAQNNLNQTPGLIAVSPTQQSDPAPSSGPPSSSNRPRENALISHAKVLN